MIIVPWVSREERRGEESRGEEGRRERRGCVVVEYWVGALCFARLLIVPVGEG